MRRTIFSAAARPSRFLTYRRTFASSIGSKDTTPPSPIEPSQEQAHPIGAFYEAILRSPPFIPETKPEAAPKSATPEVVATLPERPKPTPTTPAPAAPKEVVEPKEEESKPAKATKSSAASAKESSSPKEPAKRTRASSKKSKSVVPDPSPSPYSFSPPPPSSSLSPPSSSISSPPPSPTSLSPPPTTTTTSSKTQSNDPPQQDDSSTPASRARIIFGRSLAGPAERAERLAAIRSQSVNIAGILVPPKPEEPDNCCMSGCVNCVWDRFRDDFEEWATLSSEAERRLLAREVGTSEGGGIESVDASMAAAERDSSSMEIEEEAGSMDDDGGGSETNWTSPAPKGKGKENKFWNEELYRNVPVGIREFMKQEKRLKEKHLREGTVGG